MDIPFILYNEYLVGFCVAIAFFPLVIKLKNILQPLSIVIVLLFLSNDFGLMDMDLSRLLDNKKSTQPLKIIKLTPGKYYVKTEKLNIRIAPNQEGKIVSSLTSGQSVKVFETKGAYARISKYFDGSGHGQSGNIAQWVASNYLIRNKAKVSSSHSEKNQLQDPI